MARVSASCPVVRQEILVPFVLSHHVAPANTVEISNGEAGAPPVLASPLQPVLGLAASFRIGFCLEALSGWGPDRQEHLG